MNLHIDQPMCADASACEQKPAMFFVLSSDMGLTHASEDGEAWLTDFRRGWLVDVLKQASASALVLGIEVALDNFEIRARFLGCLSKNEQKRHGCYLVTVETSQSNSQLALLTPREIQVAEYAIHGATNSEIACGLKIGVETVKTHLKQIYSKLEVSNRLELAQALGDSFKL